jgi:two-component system sensor histidine kinase PilS (NtrC family)
MEADRLGDLMHDLLEYGRPTPARLERGSVAQTVERAIRLCEKEARRAGVIFRCGSRPGVPDVDIDPGRFVQVFHNLIENAIQHSPPGGEVAIVTDLNEAVTAVTVSITDQGPGFRELLRVFEPFFTQRRGGTGLGLAIAQRIVQDHGGEIAARNRTEGGAVVIVTLPCPRGDSTPPAGS